MLKDVTEKLEYLGTVGYHTFDENGVWTDWTPITDSGTASNTVTITKVAYNSNKDGTHNVVNLMSDGTTVNKGTEKCTYNNAGICTKCGYNSSSSKKELLSADTGAMIDKDQVALVHAKEGVLTPEQTSILRNKILSNKPTSLLSLLTTFTDAYNHLPAAGVHRLAEHLCFDPFLRGGRRTRLGLPQRQAGGLDPHSLHPGGGNPLHRQSQAMGGSIRTRVHAGAVPADSRDFPGGGSQGFPLLVRLRAGAFPTR